MLSRWLSRPPIVATASCSLPSAYLWEPLRITSGGLRQSRCQFALTRGMSPLMPPLATMTCSARASNGVPSRSCAPAHPTTRPPCVTSVSTRCWNLTPNRLRLGCEPIAALDPGRQRQEADAAGAQPFVDVGDAALHVGFGPQLREPVRGPEFRERMPVAQCLRRAVLDAVALLLAAVHEEQAAEALFGQSAEAAFLVAVEDQHVTAMVEQLERRRNPGDPTADHQHVGRIIRHGALSPAHRAISKPNVTTARSVFSPGAIGIRVLGAGWASARIGPGAEDPGSSSIEITLPSVTPAARA